MAKTRKATTNVADSIAEFIGRSMGDLLNRKEALQRQLAEVENQIMEVGHRVNRQLGQLTTPARRRRGRRSGVKGVADQAVLQVKKATRTISPETRQKMAAAAKKRWARVKRNK